MTFSKILKTKKLQPKHPKTKEENILQLKLENIKNDIFKISKTEKLPQNPPKHKISKKLINHVRRPQINKIQKTSWCSN